MIDRGKHSILGICLSAVDYEQATETIITAAKAARPFSVSALAVHGVMTGVLDRAHAYRLNHLDLVVPDGQPVRWALNRLYKTQLPDRVYGPRLMLEVCRRAAEEDLPVFLFGGTAELLAALEHGLLERIPRLKIAGVRASLFRRLSALERQQAVDAIRQSGAALTFVGLGCPRQEVWVYENSPALGMPAIAVGAAFNFHAGQLPQAPPGLQDLGLEWLFRLVKEPARLWKRYLLLNPLFVSLLAAQWLGLRRFDYEKLPAPSEELSYG
jgi:N-acetylglucosaminyldiphosphoundecaprenol N-acetyl-beta-D-mannosaminyltransferase